MNYLDILQLAIKYGPAIKGIIDEAISNDALINKLKQLAQPVADLMQQIGAQFFPKASPNIQVVGAIIASFDPNTAKWLQGALNNLLTPSPNLVVDGIYGPRTKAAVEQMQTKLGVVVDGVAGKITQAAIAALLAKPAEPAAAPAN